MNPKHEQQLERQRQHGVANEALRGEIENALRTAFPDCPINRVVIKKGGASPQFILVLADTAPGWRVKDQNPVRREIKKCVLDRFCRHISIAASYSCLEPVAGGFIRRDDFGHIIAMHKIKQQDNA